MQSQRMYEYVVPESKVISPGMVMSRPALTESVECVACQSTGGSTGESKSIHEINT